jgi:hypothetical protein
MNQIIARSTEDQSHAYYQRNAEQFSQRSDQYDFQHVSS